MTEPIRFDDFIPGAIMGEATEVFTAALAGSWNQIFGPGQQGGAQAASLAVVLMMRSYLRVVAPRPPGNVHTRQRFTLQRAPRLDESVTTQITCIGKELRRDRRYVELVAKGRDTFGRPVYEGTMTLIWAA